MDITVYTPKHGPWTAEQLFKAAKVFDTAATKLGAKTINLLDNMQGGVLYELIEAVFFTECGLEEMTAKNWELKRNGMLRKIGLLAEKVLPIEDNETKGRNQ